MKRFIEKIIEIMKRPIASFRYKKLTFGAGWYSGENFVLFGLELLDSNNGFLTIFSFQFLKFNISLLWSTI